MDSRNITSHIYWPQVKLILEKLQGQGFKALLVGGCVRDAILGINFKDMDIATDATPEQIVPLFERVELVGKSFGVCAVVIDGLHFEVATFREDSRRSDGRHPESIRYTTLEKDVWRRDFTINALYFDGSKNQVVDFVGGEKDLAQKVLRAVGDPRVRFEEDYLRILRGIRFTARLGLSIEPQTYSAMKDGAHGIQHISRERVKSEFDHGMIQGRRKVFFELCKDLGLLSLLFKDFRTDIGSDKNDVTPQNIPNLWKDFLDRVDKGFKDPLEGWISFFLFRYRCKLGSLKLSLALQEIVVDMELLKLSNDEKDGVLATLRDAHLWLSVDQKTPEDFLNWSLQKKRGLLSFWRDELAAFGYSPAHFANYESFCAQFTEGGVLPHPLVSGQDLMGLGVAAGPKMKTHLEQIYKLQVLGKIKSKDLLIQEAKKIISA